MSTRRDIAAAALVGLPVLAHASRPGMDPYGEDAARIISYTIYAEARGEPFKGKLAVAAVIQTRARLSGISLASVCLQKKQFSCWNELSAVPDFFITGEGMRRADIQARSDCYSIAWVVLTAPRKWNHLTHFYNPSKASPSWAGALRGKKTIGNHVFGYMAGYVN